MTMNVEVTELGPMKRALRIEVPADEVTQRFSRAYTELNRQVQVEVLALTDKGPADARPLADVVSRRLNDLGYTVTQESGNENERM